MCAYPPVCVCAVLERPRLWTPRGVQDTMLGLLEALAQPFTNVLCAKHLQLLRTAHTPQVTHTARTHTGMLAISQPELENVFLINYYTSAHRRWWLEALYVWSVRPCILLCMSASL